MKNAVIFVFCLGYLGCAGNIVSHKQARPGQPHQLVVKLQNVCMFVDLSKSQNQIENRCGCFSGTGSNVITLAGKFLVSCLLGVTCVGEKATWQNY